MLFKEFDQTIKFSYFIPPSIFLQDSEDSSQDISAVRSSSSIAGKSSILDDDQNSSGVIKDYVQFFEWHNLLFHFLDWKVDKFCEFVPGFIDVLDFIYVEETCFSHDFVPDFTV